LKSPLLIGIFNVAKSFEDFFLQYIAIENEIKAEKKWDQIEVITLWRNEE
jgi:hypothetical protein